MSSRAPRRGIRCRKWTRAGSHFEDVNLAFATTSMLGPRAAAAQAVRANPLTGRSDDCSAVFTDRTSRTVSPAKAVGSWVLPRNRPLTEREPRVLRLLPGPLADRPGAGPVTGDLAHALRAAIADQVTTGKADFWD